MVSLAAIEQLAAELWPNEPSATAATPDLRKGERVILVTQRQGASRSDFVAHARKKGMSELMIPAEVIVVDRLPLLGSGKIDFAAVGKVVRARETPPSHDAPPVTKTA